MFEKSITDLLSQRYISEFMPNIKKTAFYNNEMYAISLLKHENSTVSISDIPLHWQRVLVHSAMDYLLSNASVEGFYSLFKKYIFSTYAIENNVIFKDLELNTYFHRNVLFYKESSNLDNIRKVQDLIDISLKNEYRDFLPFNILEVENIKGLSVNNMI